ncbi:Ig-like domain-containing protein [Agromyces soli]|uniref:Uncharacterized protein n=1 Tax=Agromyces soli TaxID=659012 RepID=A0ABY4AYI7_9MICO|nr:SdrD B-like domain-containing protein [Agromyces soli]UOE27899.1 hypothetical protein MTP13_09030 [Agromyces soli]
MRRRAGARPRRVTAIALAMTMAAGGLAAMALGPAPAAAAAEQNGYVFNDAWELTGDDVSTQYSPNSPGYHSASSQLPTRFGPIQITADFAPNPDRSPGSTLLRPGATQSNFGGQAAMFTGAPNPADVPALGLYPNASEGCGGPLGSAGHQNTAEPCDVGVLTFTFSKPVTDPVLDLSGLGGFAWTSEPNGQSKARGSFNSTVWRLASADVAFTALSGGATNLTTDGTTLGVANRNSATQCNDRTQNNAGTSVAFPETDYSGCGSVTLSGTFTSVSFDIAALATPFTQFPAATHGTGSAYFVDDGTGAFDGVNGGNLTPSETSLTGNPNPSQNSDLQRVSFRLPQLGAIGDRVWHDENADGIQDAGEPGLEGVTVELLDGNGDPVLDENGQPVTTTTGPDGEYSFGELPFGAYKVRMSGAPEGMAPTVRGAGGDSAADSDLDPATGESEVIELDSARPTADDVDGGFVVLPVAVDDESHGNRIGDPVTVPTLGNDEGELDPSTVRITDPESGDLVEELVVPGEGTWSVDPDTGEITFTPEAGFTGNPTPIDYTVDDVNGNATGATVTVTYLPEAVDDESLNNPQGATVTVPTVGNDRGELDASTVRITDPESGDPVTELVVPGEGTWSVDPDTGEITFTPEAGFTGNPTPIDYTVDDVNGNPTGATVTVTYLPEAVDDESLNNPQGATVTVPTVDNDRGDLDPSTVRITDPESGDPVTELVVPGEGTWSVDPDTGEITFTPEAGFTGNPTPIDYTVDDVNGNATGATVTVTYLPEAVDDESHGNRIGDPVTVPTLDNDRGQLDPSTVRITDPESGDPVTELVVPGEGTWSVDPDTGDLTFTPEPGFEGDPTPIDYTVDDVTGNPTGATVTVTYVPEAVDDESLNNPQGATVTVPTVGNDRGQLDPSTVRITDPESGDPVEELLVPGEGTWSVDPDTGDITFTPGAGFTGNPTPIDYTVDDVNGNATGATVTVTYVPEAVDDESLGNPRGSAVTVPVLGNDAGDLDPSTVRIIDPASGEPVTELVVPGEGTWTVDPDTGDLTFTPEPGFEGDPTPIDYTVSDRAGNATRATVTIGYVDVTEPGQPSTPIPAPPGTPAGSGDGDLARTGAEIGLGLTAAAVLLLLGGLAALLARIERRRRRG